MIKSSILAMKMFVSAFHDKQGMEQGKLQNIFQTQEELK